MKNKFSIIFALIFCLVFLISTEAQTALKNDEIPDDLLIILKSEGKFSSAYSVITITADGSWSSKSYLELREQSSSKIISNDGRRTKLSTEKLKSLISEFEKVQFFNNFSKQVLDKEKNSSPTEAGTEIISIRINDQTKEISYYLGQGKQTKLLRDLGEKIRGVEIWNLEDGEIPDNFEVSYRITDGDKIQKDLKINAEGKVTETIYSSKFYPEAGKELPIFIESKTVGKLSKQQLRQLINEFEKAVFSAFKYSILTKYSGCSNDPVSTLERRTHINVQISHKSQMYASLYENCNPKPETDAAKFEYINSVIKELLKSVEVAKIN